MRGDIPTGDPDDEWRWLVESTTEINDFARSVGVRVAVEPINRFETYVVNRIDQALALCDAVGADLGVAIDTFHMNIEEDDLFGAIKRAGSRVFDVHVADNNRMPAGLGSIDWTRVLTALDEIGYDGPLAAEFVANVDRTPANRYPGALETDLDKLNIDPMQRQFIIDHGSTILTESFYEWMTKVNAEYLRGLE